jgi:hypothetical protein
MDRGKAWGWWLALEAAPNAGERRFISEGRLDMIFSIPFLKSVRHFIARQDEPDPQVRRYLCDGDGNGKGSEGVVEREN